MPTLIDDLGFGGLSPGALSILGLNLLKPPGGPPRIPPAVQVPPTGGGPGFMPPPPIDNSFFPIGGKPGGVRRVPPPVQVPPLNGGGGGGAPVMTDTPQTPTFLGPPTPAPGTNLFQPNPTQAIIPPNIAALFDATGNYIGPNIAANPSFLGNMSILRGKFGGPPLDPTLGGGATVGGKDYTG